MESTARSLGQLILRLYENEPPGRIIATGGGAKNDLWLQIKSEITGLEFIVTDCDEPACRGAAMLGALAFGWFESLQDVTAKWVKVEKRFQPEPESVMLYRRLR
jgi:xylulokinase